MDTRTKANIETLHPNAQAWARAHLQAIEASGVLPSGYTVKIISGHRSWAEQDKLYAQGRTQPGNIVTNARGGQSSHNFQIAWDIGIFDEKGKYLGSSPLYARLGPVGEEIGLEWGGRWKSFPDQPHYSVRTGYSTSGLRALVRAGKPIPVPPYGGSAAPPTGDSVEVWDGKRKTSVPAFLEGGRVWVAVRPFCHEFGGVIQSVDGPNFVIGLHDEVVSLAGTIKDGAGYAKFADINRVLEWGFSYEAGRLTILSEEA